MQASPHRAFCSLLLNILVLIGMAPSTASAISTYFVSIDAALVIEGGPTEIIDVSEAVFPPVEDMASTTGFPSFTFGNESSGYDPATLTLSVLSENNGAAIFAGGIDRAIVAGVTRTLGALTLVNPSRFGFFLDIRVLATIEYVGTPDSGGYAEAIADLQFYGDPDIRPAGSLFSEHPDTSMPGFETGWDITTTINETYSVLIPPSSMEISPGVYEFRLYSLGLLLQAGGAAASNSGGSAIIFPGPIAPEVIPADELFAATQEMNCVTVSDLFEQETFGLHAVNLGLVRIVEARLPGGATVPLNITDCSGDGLLDVEIPSSEIDGDELATLEISPNACEGNPPQVVEVILRHTAKCVLHAFDESGNLVASATAAGHDAPQSLILSSPGGIRTVQFQGAEICVLRVCWICEIPVTPTPTPSVTPTETHTETPSETPTETSTGTPTASPTRTSSATHDFTPTPNPTPTPDYDVYPGEPDGHIDARDLLILLQGMTQNFNGNTLFDFSRFWMQ